MATTEAKFSVSFKTRSGDLFTVRGDTAEELQKHLTDVSGGALAQIVNAVHEVLAAPDAPAGRVEIRKPAVADDPFGDGAAPQARPVAQVSAADLSLPNAAKASPAVTAYSRATTAPAAEGAAERLRCEHGYLVERSGVSAKNGKPWHGWFCPSRDRDQQCAPRFF